MGAHTAQTVSKHVWVRRCLLPTIMGFKLVEINPWRSFFRQSHSAALQFHDSFVENWYTAVVYLRRFYVTVATFARWVTTMKKYHYSGKSPVKLKEHSQKLTSYLFQNDVVLYFKPYWKRENAADINFWCFIKLKDWAFQWKKNKLFSLTRSKVMVLTSEREIAASNGMWLTYQSHL